jgi:hypothetical protein
VRTGDQFGRVTERGPFHTELQTEDRDLTTLPDLFLITNPVTVVRYSGTIVSATVTLGYGVDHALAERLLCRAAEAAGLTEAFVHIVSLGDVSVEYRAAGLLTEVKHLLSAPTSLLHPRHPSCRGDPDHVPRRHGPASRGIRCSLHSAFARSGRRANPEWHRIRENRRF